MIIPVKIDRGDDANKKGGEGATVGGDKTIGEQTTHSEGKTATSVATDRMNVPQWSMVELQGELLSRDPLSGQAIGSMTFENGKCSLVIGNHKLDGKAAQESKPLLVLRKVILPDDGNSNHSNNDDGDTNFRKRKGGGETGTLGRDGSSGRDVVWTGPPRVQYRIVGKITRKTIFKTRPKPLIRKPGGSSTFLMK